MLVVDCVGVWVPVVRRFQLLPLLTGVVAAIEASMSCTIDALVARDGCWGRRWADLHVLCVDQAVDSRVAAGYAVTAGPSAGVGCVSLNDQQARDMVPTQCVS